MISDFISNQVMRIRRSGRGEGESEAGSGGESEVGFRIRCWIRSGREASSQQS
jgi:hypothetical protein